MVIWNINEDRKKWFIWAPVLRDAYCLSSSKTALGLAKINDTRFDYFSFDYQQCFLFNPFAKNLPTRLCAKN